MKKIIAMLLAALMLFGLVACGSVETAEEPAQTEPTEETEAPKEETPAETADEKPYAGTTISVIGANLGPTVWMYDHLDEFEAETGITVLMEELALDQINSKTMVSMAAGGSDTDVIFFQPENYTRMYASNGWLEPLEEYIKDEEYDFNDFTEGSYIEGQYDGIQYSIPLYGIEPIVVFYNKAMIEEAGIDVSAIKTWDDLEEACKTVEEKISDVSGIGLRGQGHNSVTIAVYFCRAYGGNYLDEEGNAIVNTPEFIAGLKKYRELLEYAPDGWQTATINETINFIAQKMVAFRVDTMGSYPYSVDPESSLLKNGDIGFLPMLEGPVRAATQGGNWGVGISSGSLNKGAAWEFIKWMTNKENTKQQVLDYNGIPARVSVMEDPDVVAMYPEGYMEVMQKSADIAFGNTLPNIKYSAEARTLLGAALDEVFAGGDAQAIMDRANEELQALIDQQREEEAVQ